MPVRSTQETQVDTTFKRSKNRTKSPAVSKVGTIFLAPHLNIFVGLFFQFGATNFLSRDFRVLSLRKGKFFSFEGTEILPFNTRQRGSGRGLFQWEEWEVFSKEGGGASEVNLRPLWKAGISMGNLHLATLGPPDSFLCVFHSKKRHSSLCSRKNATFSINLQKFNLWLPFHSLLIRVGFPGVKYLKFFAHYIWLATRWCLS